AYVIPVPYYDRLPGGAFGSMHCESGEYPAYVPVVDWREYDFEERRPDVVVIHSPYDDGNLVTSVHPDFHSGRLKNFTDMLVYIPYFVVSGDVPEHFCTCAGVLHADRVIVQSEKAKETYIRAFGEFEKKHNCKGRFGKAETKFLALGSPKFDKALRTKREEQEVPDAWRRLFERPDGTRKKIILYNTSIGALLEGDEKMLKKLRSVFELFKERDDALLWWRPHPLNEATYAAMRPQLLAEYKRIATEYRRERVGIYDDTADLHRAIAMSDAYYGDGSSLVALYECTGKPVMIQNVNIVSDEKCIHFDKLWEDEHNEHIWFSSSEFNGLYKMDRTDWRAEYEGMFPGEDVEGFFLYSAITACKDKLYFAPRNAREIAEYDIKKRTFRKIPFSLPVQKNNRPIAVRDKFYSIATHGNAVYFVGFCIPAIMKYDVKTDILTYFTDWAEYVAKMTKEQISCYALSACCVGTMIVMPMCEVNAVVFFDMETDSTNVFEVGGKGNGYSGIDFDGRYYWLSPRHESPVVKWDPVANETAEIDLPIGFQGGKVSFLSVLCLRKTVLILPDTGNMCLKINYDDLSVTIAEDFQEECQLESGYLNGHNYIGVTSCGSDKLYLRTAKSSKLIKLSRSTGEKREACVICDKFPTVSSQGRMIHRERFKSNIFEILSETICDLENISDSSDECIRNMAVNADGTSGEAIYAHLRKELLGAVRGGT
ncbi:MAG: hypothetical protein LBP30_04530, partial [Clostridiales Family XIII bacterium]|nr:hypothetical protein [Clostridiales Family XIII bacterium]